MICLSSIVNLFVGLRPLHVLCLLMSTGVVAAQTDRFGGNPVIRRSATGFFRVEQVNGRWMLIMPEGHGYLALGANHIGKLMDGQAAELLKRFDGDEAKAGEALAQAIRDLGLNAGEAYAPYWPKLQRQMPWVANVTYPQGAANFQFDVFDPKMLVIDWAAPFSLGEAFDSEHGRIKTEPDAAEDSAKWITAALAHSAIVGVFRCQLIGTHGNDRWFEGKAKRTYLRDDGTPLPIMAARVREANQAALKAAYDTAAMR